MYLKFYFRIRTCIGRIIFQFCVLLPINCLLNFILIAHWDELRYYYFVIIIA